MSRGPIRHREDLDVLPKEDSFVFQDHLQQCPAVWYATGRIGASSGR